MENRHNGWTNYATWRVNLENYSDINHETIIECYSYSSIGEIAEMMKNEIEERLECNNDLTYSYALAFVSDVNYYEIAYNIVMDVIENICYNNDILIDKNSVNGYITISKRINDELVKATFDDITINDVLEFIEI